MNQLFNHSTAAYFLSRHLRSFSYCFTCSKKLISSATSLNFRAPSSIYLKVWPEVMMHLMRAYPIAHTGKPIMIV